MKRGQPAAAPVRLGGRFWRLWTASVISNLGDGVGAIAFPWLASAVTRHPVLIALIAVAQRLPWLVFTLPAGVITDRLDRRRIILWAEAMTRREAVQADPMAEAASDAMAETGIASLPPDHLDES